MDHRDARESSAWIDACIHVFGLACMVFVAFAFLSRCSPSVVHTQAVAADTVGRASNGALEVVKVVYRDQVLAAARAACGNTIPCADPQAAHDAKMAVRAQWAPVWSAWALVGVAHAAWRDQLNRCQGLQDGGADAGDCGPQLSELAFTLLTRTTQLRCGLVGLHVDDPLAMLGALDCSHVVVDETEDAGHE